MATFNGYVAIHVLSPLSFAIMYILQKGSFLQGLEMKRKEQNSYSNYMLSV